MGMLRQLTTPSGSDGVPGVNVCQMERKMAGPREVSLRTLRTARIVLVGVVLLMYASGRRMVLHPDPLIYYYALLFPCWQLASSRLCCYCVGESCSALKTDWHVNRVTWRRFRRWRAIQLVILACFLAIPLYGLVLRFQGGTLLVALQFYSVGILLLSFLPIHEAERT